MVDHSRERLTTQYALARAAEADRMASKVKSTQAQFSGIHADLYNYLCDSILSEIEGIPDGRGNKLADAENVPAIIELQLAAFDNKETAPAERQQISEKEADRIKLAAVARYIEDTPSLVAELTKISDGLKKAASKRRNGLQRLLGLKKGQALPN